MPQEPKAGAVWQKVAEAALEAVVGLDAEGRICFANSEALRQTGFAVAEIQGRHISDLHASPAETARVLAVALDEGIWRGTIEHRRKDGSRYTGSASCTRIDDAGEGGPSLLYCVLDVSSRGQAGDLGAEAFRLSGLGTLAHSVVHEFNNVLGLVMGHADIALGAGDEESMREALEIVVETAHDGQTFTSLLLSCARGYEGDVVRGDVRDVLARPLDIARKALGRDGIRIRKRIAEVPPAAFDPSLLQEACFHLISRAQRIMAGGRGLLTVTTCVVDDCVSVCFADTGRPEEGSEDDAGRPAGGDERLLDPALWSLELAGECASRFGGRIEVSANDPRGTRVEILVPTTGEGAALPEPDAEDSAERSEEAAGPCRVLIVDDNKGICDLFAQALATAKHRVHKAYGSEEAIRSASENTFDVIVLDVHMPGRSGVQALRAIHEIQPEARPVFITGQPTPELIEATRELAAPVLCKPFSLSSLLRTVGTAAAGGQGR